MNVLTSPLRPAQDVAVGGRLLWGLLPLLRHPIDIEQARATVRRRLEQRERDFLALIRRAVYPQPASPYRRLLELAGCEYGDLEQLVLRDGLEASLRRLYRHGVYLSTDELKGRRPAIRGSARIRVNVSQLRNSRSGAHVSVSSSGASGNTTLASIDLASVRDEAVNCCVIVGARGEHGWVQAHWGVPGGASIARLMQFSLFGTRSVHWFTQVHPAAAGLHARYRWSARALSWASLLAGARLSRPTYAPVDKPLVVAAWMADILRSGRIPHLWTFVGPAVRLCQAALEAGVELRGAQLTVGGEPTTEARLNAIRGAGAIAVPVYASTESGLVGYGCLGPQAPDDLHFFSDLHALIQSTADEGADFLPPRTLLLSSLRPTARFILLNFSLGDRADVTKRACDCPLDGLGWTTHLHAVRSFEKLTAGGMTFPDDRVIDVLEQVLPARFGGGPTDYQLLEEEAEDGRPVIRLLVHPRLGALDGDAVADTFLAAIGGGSGAERVMELQWRQAGWLNIERRAPLTTASSKVLHLHRETNLPGA
jgi:hypothetical protein